MSMKTVYSQRLRKWTPIVLIFVAIIVILAACKKLSGENPISSQKEVLKKSSSDYSSRLEEIKQTFYRKKLDKVIQPSTNASLT